MKPMPRSVGRYRPGLALVAGATGLAATLGVLASPGDASPRPDSPASPAPLRIGMGSCAARGCHGAVDEVAPAQGRVYIKDGAYTTWLQYDPHAGAYAALLGPRSVAIAAKLAGPLGGKPAHEAGLCLSCHSTTGPPGAKVAEAAPPRDGISCEACHGPAEAWQDKHLSASWRGLPPASKALDGMADLGTPAARARLCVGCHVGDRSRGMDMNHDLIAAGHPRLNFEFGSYLASYPKHWREPHEGTGPREAAVASDFEARSWAVGQVVTAGAVLDLLAARALASKDVAARPPAPEAVWPEFSEYECFACHHGLTSPSPRQVAGRPAGRPPWQAWPSTMLPILAGGRRGVDLGPWDEIRAEMARPIPDPDRVAALAARSRGALDGLLEDLESGPFDRDRVAALLKGLTSGPPPAFEGWDRAAQRLLAIEALARASKGLGLAIGPEADRAIVGGSEALDFPPGYDSPRSLSPPVGPKPSPNPTP